MYESRGFRVTNIHADPEFLCVKNEMLPLHLNIAVVNERIGEVERSIRTTKEVLKCMAHGLPFKKILRLVVRSMVIGANTRINDNYSGWSPPRLLGDHQN